jgi:CrcB protein
MERRGLTALRWFLLPGFCGGMTTFSAVTIEVVGEDARGFDYLALTVIASLLTVAVVIAYARATIKVKQ